MSANGIDLLMDVLDRAQARCECTGQCGATHDGPDGRCQIDDSGQRPRCVVVAPRNPGSSPIHDLRRPAQELMAWCTACLDAAEQQAEQGTD